MRRADEMDLTELHFRLSEALKVGDFRSKSDKYFAMRMVGKCKKGQDITPEDEARMRQLVDVALCGPLTEAEVEEVTRESKGRLERLCDAIVYALRRLKLGEKPDAELTQAFRDELGPTERLFLAGAAALALDHDQLAGLAEAALRDASAGLTDMQAFTVVCHQAAIKQARKGGDEAKALELEQGLARLQGKWAEVEDAA